MEKRKSFLSKLLRRVHRMILYSKGFIKSYLPIPKTNEDYPIDIVVTWLDGSDESWLEEKRRYFEISDSQTQLNNPVERYRDWDLLQFWFRAIEEYAPWARYIFFVTCGHKPKWLNTENSKLRFVSHKDFIPPEYLPTFCSDTIELNLWRIKDLSEHFLYFNDDVFLNKPVKPNDFFVNGLPRIMAIARPVRALGEAPNWTWERRHMNDCAIINASFDIGQEIEKSPEKWFSHVIGVYSKYNRRIYVDKFINGMAISHSVMPFLKESFREIWQDWFSVLDMTCKGKFRSDRDVTVCLPLFWNVFKGTFSPVPRDYYGKYISLSKESIDEAIEIISQGNCIAVCLNDCPLTLESDVPMLRLLLTEAFMKKFPQKSSFEK